MDEDWNEIVPYSECTLESDVIERAYAEYSDLSPSSLKSLTLLFGRVEQKARRKHYEQDKTSWDLYAEGMPRPEWDVWWAYRRARILAGVCRSLAELKRKQRQNFDLEGIPTSETLLRRGQLAFQVASKLPEEKRSIGTVCQEVADTEGVATNTVRRMFNRRLKKGEYKDLHDLLPLLEFLSDVAELIELDIPLSKVDS